MAELRVGGEVDSETPFILKKDTNLVWKDHVGKEMACGTKLKLLQVEVIGITPSKYNDLEIHAKFEDSHRYTNAFSKIGFWAPFEDKRINHSSGHIHLKHSDSIFVSLKDWIYGKEAKMKLKLQDDNTIDENFSFILGVRPVFGTEHDSDVKCTISLTGKSIGGRESKIGIHTLNFELDNQIDTSDSNDDLIEIFGHLGAYNTNGKGNSVHPKQAMTIEGFDQYIMEVQEPIDVTYIGTDTTENLRSLIRHISLNQEIHEKIKSLTVYFTEDWDEEIHHYFHNELDVNKLGTDFPIFSLVAMKESTSGDKLTYHRVHNGELDEKKFEPVCTDLVIATYVTPWAMQGDKKRDYIDLCTSLLNKETAAMISIDPAKSEYSVRSMAIENENQEKQKFNLNLWYNEMNLQKRKAILKSKEGRFGIIECSKWVKSDAE
jgi:hypothetical protein